MYNQTMREYARLAAANCTGDFCHDQEAIFKVLRQLNEDEIAWRQRRIEKLEAKLAASQK